LTTPATRKRLRDAKTRYTLKSSRYLGRRVDRERVRHGPAIVRDKRIYLLIEEQLKPLNRMNNQTLKAEIYHQARMRGLYAVMSPDMDFGGYYFRPAMAFFDVHGKVYGLLKIGNTCRNKDRLNTYNRSGLPWGLVRDMREVSEMVAFMEQCLYARDLPEIKDELDLDSSHRAEHAGSLTPAQPKRGAKGICTPMRKGAFIPPTGIGGLGKFR